ncbi:TPA: acetyl-CoA carboxylase carboxyltransferase subunit alpha [Candidatus Poribacteria bacterium]|nr:acetyl-CoA carboxylase carboxyltransferase subunit alpha [Candidatus Poribacteria bacterium]
MEYRGLEFEEKIFEFEKRLAELKELASSFNTDLSAEIKAIEKQFLKEKKLFYLSLTPWQRVLISRDSQRPRSSDYINELIKDKVEMFGDRIYGDDPAIIGGIGTFRGYKVVFLGQEKGRDTKDRIAKNFGYMHPEGYRKALRLMKFAEKFGKPVISFVDTPGAAPGVEAELRGQPMAIGENLAIMSALKVPILSIVIGEGGSGGALGVGVSDKILMLENAIYCVCAPETCSQILWRSNDRAPEAAQAFKLTANELKKLGIIDEVIKEPLGGAHRDPKLAIKNVGQSIKRNLDELTSLDINELLERRYQKYREIGALDL